MKKIIILFFLICAIPLSACSKAPEQIPAPTVQRLTSPLELSEDEAATLIQCCGENSVLLAVGHRNTAQTGPLYHTDYLFYWNYSDGTTKQFPVSSPAYIISAVLDGSDVLYVDYEAMDSGLKWSLIRSTDTGKSTFFIIFHILPYPDGRRAGELRGKREGSPRRGGPSCAILHTISLCSIVMEYVFHKKH